MLHAAVTCSRRDSQAECEDVKPTKPPLGGFTESLWASLKALEAHLDASKMFAALHMVSEGLLELFKKCFAAFRARWKLSGSLRSPRVDPLRPSRNF